MTVELVDVGASVDREENKFTIYLTFVKDGALFTRSSPVSTEQELYERVERMTAVIAQRS